jgi:hypothetical protein
MSSPSVISHDTKTSKISDKDNPHDFYPKNFNHTFLPKPDLRGYRKNSKKKFEENQNYVGDEEFHQEPDHPSTFMKMVKERTRIMSAVNDERRQVLPSKVIWDGTIDRLKYLEVMLKVIMDKLLLAIYLIQVSRRLIWRRVLNVMLIFWMKYLLLSKSRWIHSNYKV